MRQAVWVERNIKGDNFVCFILQCFWVGSGGKYDLVCGNCSPERRANTRFAFSVAAEVVELRSQARITSRSSDLGLGGCYVDTLTPFPVGSPVKVRLTQANRTFEAQAAVTYAKVGMGMGLAFSEVQPDQLATLQDWVRELSGELPSSLDSAETPVPAQPFQQSERLVLNQLITLLIRKRMLTETEGATLLRQLFH